jgi:hypothetical protein
MAARPVAVPEVFTGDGKQSWSDWVDHFDSVADVNEWDASAKKKWIRARLTGRAATAFRRLPEADRATFAKIVAGLTKRFEPECRKELYVAEFQRRTKRRSEDWAAYAEDLRTLVEKAYPALQTEAQELLALNHFLAQIENVHVAFGVRQKAPTTLDAAVATTLELETYLQPKIPTAPIAQVEEQYDVIAAARYEKGGAQDLMRKLLERMERMEAKLSDVVTGEEGGSQGRDSWSPIARTLTCYNCREEGHIARNCPAKNQGNGRPSEQ